MDFRFQLTPHTEKFMTVCALVVFCSDTQHNKPRVTCHWMSASHCACTMRGLSTEAKLSPGHNWQISYPAHKPFRLSQQCISEGYVDVLKVAFLFRMEKVVSVCTNKVQMLQFYLKHVQKTLFCCQLDISENSFFFVFLRWVTLASVTRNLLSQMSFTQDLD